jgi:branched-chain amino acid transport system permease protein
LAGLLIAPSSTLSPTSLDLVLIIGFTAAVVGGLNSPIGAVVGGLIVGLVMSFVNFYMTPEDVYISILVLLLIVLIVKPRGIFSGKDSRRV